MARPGRSTEYVVPELLAVLLRGPDLDSPAACAGTAWAGELRRFASPTEQAARRRAG